MPAHRRAPIPPLMPSHGGPPHAAAAAAPRLPVKYSPLARGGGAAARQGRVLNPAKDVKESAAGAAGDETDTPEGRRAVAERAAAAAAARMEAARYGRA